MIKIARIVITIDNVMLQAHISKKECCEEPLRRATARSENAVSVAPVHVAASVVVDGVESRPCHSFFFLFDFRKMNAGSAVHALRTRTERTGGH